MALRQLERVASKVHIIIAFFVVLCIVFLVTRRTAEFEIAIENGQVKNTKGDVPRTLLDDFSRAVAGVSKGSIVGHKANGRVELSFHGDIGEGTQQRLRNIHGLHQR